MQNLMSLKITYSNDKSGSKGPKTEYSIFVGNISYNCTENDLKNFFKDCGQIADIRLAKKENGKLKGFAHVDFENKESMDKALKKNGIELHGRTLKIDVSIPK